ncbi:MAG TPA: PilZ domain-containing protein [Firmicutes bacterium]|nr:PilZ domain-containing protein [Bacillota bacterium]
MDLFRRRAAYKGMNRRGLPDPEVINAELGTAFEESEFLLQEERRKYFRVAFPQPLPGEMRILEIEGEDGSSRKANILIEDMGPGGLSFLADLLLPSDQECVLQFTTRLNNEEVTVNGRLIGVREVDSGRYRYDIEFDIDENERMKLTGLLNIVQARIRRKAAVAEESSLENSAQRYPRVI